MGINNQLAAKKKAAFLKYIFRNLSLSNSRSLKLARTPWKSRPDATPVKPTERHSPLTLPARGTHPSSDRNPKAGRSKSKASSKLY